MFVSLSSSVLRTFDRSSLSGGASLLFPISPWSTNDLHGIALLKNTGSIPNRRAKTRSMLHHVRESTNERSLSIGNGTYRQTLAGSRELSNRSISSPPRKSTILRNPSMCCFAAKESPVTSAVKPKTDTTIIVGSEIESGSPGLSNLSCRSRSVF